jgi:hypothetical protein
MTGFWSGKPMQSADLLLLWLLLLLLLQGNWTMAEEYLLASLHASLGKK